MRKILWLYGVVLLISMNLLTGCGLLQLPSSDSLNNLQLVEATQVFDRNGNLIAKLFEENRTVVPLSRISPYVQQAIIANEDIRFYQHIGIDPIGIMRAMWVNLRSGSVAEGGSTLTQQLAKNMFLTQEQTLTRKVNEAALALLLEQKFSKQEILETYLNQVYFGEGAYGIEAAAQTYFAKTAHNLTLAESAMLAGLPRGPALYSPYADLAAAKERRHIVLAGMVKAGSITQAEADAADKEKIVLGGKKKRAVQASYFLDYVAEQLTATYGSERVYRGGLKVYTTLDSQMQQAAEQVLGEQQGGVLILDPKNGYVWAMVGGNNYEKSQTNRVIQEVRQPGSAFKPFVYATALNQGLAENSLVVDEPVKINGYAPQNYDKKYRGPITLKKALSLSVNMAAVKLGQQVTVKEALHLARAMGVSTLAAEDDNLAACLGGLTNGVNLLELCSAYTGFANGGIVSKPLSIIKVLDEKNQVLEEHTPTQQSVLSPQNAYLLTDMLREVVAKGTARSADIGRPVAGKTGTTDNYETAWFVGYTPDFLAGIYIGNDDRKPVGISGSEVAGMWGKLARRALANQPVVNFTVPEGLVTGIAVCSSSGKRAEAGCQEIEYDAFVKGTEPTEVAAKKNGQDKAGQEKEKNTQADKQDKQEKSLWKSILSRLPKL